MPIVIRIPYGGGIGAAEHHSESPETYYAHTAGLKVVVPSSPIDAYHLLRAAIADPDPVIYFATPRMYFAYNARVQGVKPSVLRPVALWNADMLSVRSSGGGASSGAP